MMALGHTLLGSAIGLATVGVVQATGDHETAVQAAWVLTWAGCSLGPDLDAHGTTVSRMWGPITDGFRPRIWGKRRKLVPGITDLVGAICGGHRRGSHSVLGTIVVLAMVWLASLFVVGTAIVVAILTGLGICAVCLWLPGKQAIEKNWPANVAISALAAYAAYRVGWTLPGWVPWAMAGGTAAHILGDMLTKTGCPLNWPREKTRVSLLPMRAGGPAERWIAVPLLVTLNVLLLAYLAGYDPIGRLWLALTA